MKRAAGTAPGPRRHRRRWEAIKRLRQRLAQALLQRLELAADLVRQVVAEARQVLLDLRQLLAQRLRVDRDQLAISSSPRREARRC